MKHCVDCQRLVLVSSHVLVNRGRHFVFVEVRTHPKLQKTGTGQKLDKFLKM